MRMLRNYLLLHVTCIHILLPPASKEELLFGRTTSLSCASSLFYLLPHLEAKSIVDGNICVMMP